MKKTILAGLLSAATIFTAQAEEAAKPRLANGLLMQQDGKLVFAPCRDRSYALLEDVSVNGALTSALNSVGLGAGKKLYVEVFAIVDGATIKASGLNLARAEGRCQPPAGKDEAWRAAGAGWSLVAGGEVVVLRRQGKPDISVPYRASAADAEIFDYEASQDGRRLSLRFVPESCEDKAGNALLGWKAVVKADGEPLDGCAWRR